MNFRKVKKITNWRYGAPSCARLMIIRGGENIDGRSYNYSQTSELRTVKDGTERVPDGTGAETTDNIQGVSIHQTDHRILVRRRRCRSGPLVGDPQASKETRLVRR